MLVTSPDTDGPSFHLIEAQLSYLQLPCEVWSCFHLTVDQQVVCRFYKPSLRSHSNWRYCLDIPPTGFIC
jgi:hypothetical protein